MKLGTYCQTDKKNDFLCLLNFARISHVPAAQDSTAHDKKAVANALNMLPDSFNPALRPILPLIYRSTIIAGLRDTLFPETIQLLRKSTLRLVAEEIINLQWLRTTLDDFEKEKIPVILLKGAAFSENLYPADSPRVGVDLDFLVTEDNFKRACALLDKTMNPVLLSEERIATHDTLFERVFSPKKGTNPTVEIHRALTNPSIFNINEEKLWEASRQHPAFKSNLIRILSPEDTLLHLAVHAFRDLNFCTHNILDAHEIWCQWNPDSEKLLQRAEKWGAGKVLFYLLVNCQEIMETPIPAGLLMNIQPGSVVDTVNKKILRAGTQEKSELSAPARRLIQMLSQITFPDHITSGLRFQWKYAMTRLHDWQIARKRKQEPPL